VDTILANSAALSNVVGLDAYLTPECDRARGWCSRCC